jgi:predicted DNA-binding transcriptional regulator YafY
MASHSHTLGRQWLLLQRVPRYPHKTTAGELTRRLHAEGHDVSKRTVERDLAALSEVFPLISDERVKPFGWSWQKEAPQFSVPGMSPLQAMVLSLAHTHLNPLLPAHLLEPLRSYFNQADATLRQVLGKRGASDWNKRVAIVQPTQPLLPPKINESALATVHEALARQKQVELLYRSHSAERRARYRVHPLGLVFRGVVVYLVGTIGEYQDPRSLALHRVEHAQMLDEAADPPKGFELHAFVNSGAFGFHESGSLDVVLRIEAPAAAHLYETPLSESQTIVPDEREGWVRVSARVLDTSQLRWWILAFGEQLEVIAPSELRNEVSVNLRHAQHNYLSKYPGAPT